MNFIGKRILLYVRVSTEEQARHGESILDQSQALHQWAEKNGCVIVGEYHDEGFSARKSYKTRPALTSLLSDVERGIADAVVFTKLDRWFRNLKDYHSVQEILERHSVFWCAILEDYETQTSAGRFKVNLMLSIAEHEADQTSERIKFTFSQKRERGEIVSGHMPTGYKLENGKPVKDPETQAGMESFWKEYMNTRSISSAMSAAGKNGLHIIWYQTAASIIRNASRYAGAIQGVPCEPYITCAERDIILASRQRCPRRTNINYLFAGIIRCGECGRALGACRDSYVKRDGSRSVFYRCNRACSTKNSKCANKSCIKEDVIEFYLLTELENAVQQAIVTVLARPKENIRDTTQDISRLNTRLDRLTDAYLDGAFPKSEYIRRREEIEQAIKALTPQKKPVKKSAEELIGLLPSGWRQMYDMLDNKHKHTFWIKIIKEIKVYGDKTITFEIID